MDKLNNIPEMQQVTDFIEGNNEYPEVPQVDRYVPHFRSFADQADSAFSAADEQELDRQREAFLDKELNTIIKNHTADGYNAKTLEDEFQEAQERWELSKLKTKYERVAEKDEC